KRLALDIAETVVTEACLRLITPLPQSRDIARFVRRMQIAEPEVAIYLVLRDALLDDIQRREPHVPHAFDVFCRHVLRERIHIARKAAYQLTAVASACRPSNFRGFQ